MLIFLLTLNSPRLIVQISVHRFEIMSYFQAARGLESLLRDLLLWDIMSSPSPNLDEYMLFINANVNTSDDHDPSKSLQRGLGRRRWSWERRHDRGSEKSKRDFCVSRRARRPALQGAKLETGPKEP